MMKLCEDLALRIAELSAALGMDDADEALLWRYVADFHRDGVAHEISRVLLNQAERDPYLVLSYSWKASMPSRFISASRWIFSKKCLNQTGFERLSKENQIQECLADFRTGVLDRVRNHCFIAWYSKITAHLKEDGVSWEPPTADDIEVSLQINALRLRDFLSIDA